MHQGDQLLKSFKLYKVTQVGNLSRPENDQRGFLSN